MIDAIFTFLGPVLTFLSTQYGQVGTIIGYLVFIVAPAMTILIELAETVVILTASTKDDQAVASIKTFWGKFLKFLEVIPHANIPIAPSLAKVLLYFTKGGAAAKAALDAWNKA